MFERYILAYVFLCFAIGIACLGLVLNLARQRDSRLARAFLGFYVALTAFVTSALLLALVEAFPAADSHTTRSTLEYFESIVGFYGVMFTLPFFAHRVFGVAGRRRDRGLLIFVVVALAIQHVTEYTLNDVWDQRGDMLENVLFSLAVAYVFWLGFSRRTAAGTARPLGDRMLALMVLGIPIFVHDMSLAESTGLRLYPVAYCVFSIVVTWTLAQSTSATPSEFALNPRWKLSDRETQVLLLVQRGLSNKDIGSQLYISPNTVKTHVRSIFEKTGAQSRFELIAMAQAAPERLDPASGASPTGQPATLDPIHPKE